MGYKNKTYVIFDGDEDIWAYGFMVGWKKSEHIDFNFFNAHDVNEIRNGTLETTVKKKLKERIGDTKQAVVLVGPKTKNLFRYVRWEIETMLELGIPIVASNLNQKRRVDPDLCPPILRDTCTVHVGFRAKIIQRALDNFCDNFANFRGKADLYYGDDVYRQLGLPL